MDRKDKSELKALKKYSKKFNRPLVVVLALEGNSDVFRVLTHGASDEMADYASDIGARLAMLVTISKEK